MNDGVSSNDQREFEINKHIRLTVGSFDMNDKSMLAEMFLGNISENSHIVGKEAIWGLTFLVPGRPIDAQRNYREGVVREKIDEDIVRVLYIKPWTKEMREKAPKASMDARLGWETIWGREFLQNNSPEKIFGMQCFTRPESDRSWRQKVCLAERADAEWAIIDYHEIRNGKPPNPFMQTSYYSPRYGGVEVAWISSAENISEWKEIDQRLWNLLDRWIVSN